MGGFMAIKKSTSHDEQDLLTPEQFAGKLQIGRSTLFSWLAQGILVEGVHYFRVGRVLRFSWDRDVLLQIREVRISEPQRPVHPISGKHPVNWEY